MKQTILLLSLILFSNAAVTAQNMVHDNDHKKLVQMLNDFRMAIINNNQEKASELLTKDAKILESRSIETKEKYLSHHFHSGGKFLSAMEREVKMQEVKSTENTA
jgi:hemerythrin